jgi:pyrroline-5-carboxylate reductase
MVKETGLHPAELKEQVTSPGGTTAAGLQVLEAAAIRSILIQAVKAATHRSETLSTGGRP